MEGIRNTVRRYRQSVPYASTAGALGHKEPRDLPVPFRHRTKLQVHIKTKFAFTHVAPVSTRTSNARSNFYRKVMREIKDDGIENIIIDCSIDILEEVLRQAQQVGIMSEKNKIIVTSLVITSPALYKLLKYFPG